MFLSNSTSSKCSICSRATMLIRGYSNNNHSRWMLSNKRVVTVMILHLSHTLKRKMMKGWNKISKCNSSNSRWIINRRISLWIKINKCNSNSCSSSTNNNRSSSRCYTNSSNSRCFRDSSSNINDFKKW